jgi:hypothetical protein
MKRREKLDGYRSYINPTTNEELPSPRTNEKLPCQGREDDNYQQNSKINN